MNFSSRLGSVLTMFTYISRLFTSFSVMTPFLITSSGNSSKIVATLFCTLTAARSGSVPTANVTSMATVPLLLETEDICVIPGTPLIAFSSGVATVFEQTSALAPRYLALTETDGGMMSGYWLMGSEKKDKAPSKTINKDITRERT